MDIFHIFLIIIISLLTTYILSKAFNWQANQVKFQTLDGLRGYLALFVYLSHVFVWKNYLKNNNWGDSVPINSIFTGEICVILFFMISAFLFYNRILDIKLKPIDWIHFYLSRLLRLWPIYLFAIGILTIIIVCTSIEVNETKTNLILKLVGWSTFGLVQYKKISGVEDLMLKTTNVIWTLRYEWLFYFTLPFFAWLNAGQKYVSIGILIITLSICVFIFSFYPYHYLVCLTFLVGGFAAQVIKSNVIQYFSEFLSTLIILGCFVFLITNYSTGFGVRIIILISIPFTFIAQGNSLMGILSHKISRLLSQLTYSIYLLHFIFLYISFELIFDHEYSLEHFWSIVIIQTIIMICICYFLNRFIENPIIKFSQKFKHLRNIKK